MVKKAETIGRYKIREWVDWNFPLGVVDVEFTAGDRAVIKDGMGEQMKIRYVPGKGIVEEA